MEPISQAAANQRAGRCGRVASGVCIRLYDEDDFQARPGFTEPEILRSSLAGVILRMKSLHLGEVEDFPLHRAAAAAKRSPTAIDCSHELGAVDDANELTRDSAGSSRACRSIRASARMILAARRTAACAEVLIIAAALSVQDPRDRPMEAQARPITAHAKFADEKSDFLRWLKIWNWYRGGARAQEIQPQSAGACAATTSCRTTAPARMARRAFSQC